MSSNSKFERLLNFAKSFSKVKKEERCFIR